MVLVQLLRLIIVSLALAISVAGDAWSGASEENTAENVFNLRVHRNGGNVVSDCARDDPRNETNCIPAVVMQSVHCPSSSRTLAPLLGLLGDAAVAVGYSSDRYNFQEDALDDTESLPLPGSPEALDRWGHDGRGSNRTTAIPTGSTSGQFLAWAGDLLGLLREEEVVFSGSVPLRIFSIRGQRILTCSDLSDLPLRSSAAAVDGAPVDDGIAENDHRTGASVLRTPVKAIDVYLVPASEHFVWPVQHLGARLYPGTRVRSGQGSQELEMEVISQQPRLFRVRGFLSSQECDALVSAGAAGMEPSKLYVTDPSKAMDASIRSSSQAWVRGGSNTIADRISSRVADLVRIPKELGLDEDMQVLRYDPGQHYHSHHDYFRPWDFPQDTQFARGVNRFVTVFFYLSDVEAGGETVFPLSTAAEDRFTMDDIQYDSCSKGVLVQPQQGDAILWYHLTAGRHMNPLEAFDFDVFSLHGACDVKSGRKWAANKWIRNKK